MLGYYREVLDSVTGVFMWISWRKEWHCKMVVLPIHLPGQTEETREMKRRLGYSVSLPRFEQYKICSAAVSLVQLKIEKFIWTWSVIHKFLSFFFQNLHTKAVVRTSARSVPEDAMKLLRHSLPSGLLLSLSRPHFAYLGLYSVLHGFVSAIFTRMEVISSYFTFSGLV
jgi:hypothetical protein